MRNEFFLSMLVKKAVRSRFVSAALFVLSCGSSAVLPLVCCFYCVASGVLASAAFLCTVFQCAASFLLLLLCCCFCCLTSATFLGVVPVMLFLQLLLDLCCVRMRGLGSFLRYLPSRIHFLQDLSRVCSLRFFSSPCVCLSMT